jgi:hypothetical protein
VARSSITAPAFRVANSPRALERAGIVKAARPRGLGDGGRCTSGLGFAEGGARPTRRARASTSHATASEDRLPERGEPGLDDGGVEDVAADEGVEQQRGARGPRASGSPLRGVPDLADGVATPAVIARPRCAGGSPDSLSERA